MILQFFVCVDHTTSKFPLGLDGLKPGTRWIGGRGTEGVGYKTSYENSDGMDSQKR